MTLRSVVPLLLLVVATSCLGRSAREARRLEGRYDLGSMGPGWVSVQPGGADKAFNNPELAATVYTDSNCGTRYEDTSLDRLVQSVLHGVVDGKAEPVSKTEGSIDGRAALTVRQRGSLDGVPVELAVVVVKKDLCVYDMVLIGPPDERFEQAWTGFHAATDGFRTTR